jgi:hypothetical protein
MAKGTRRTTWWKRVIRWEREDACRQGAAAVMDSVDGKEAHCPDAGCPEKIRYLKAVEAAAILIDVGLGRYRPVPKPAPCSAVVAAEARMAAGQR